MFHQNILDNYSVFLLLKKFLHQNRHHNLSNKSFLEKRDDEVHGYRNSKLYMNKYLGKLDEWNLLSMEARFESLYEDIVKIWKRPEDKVTDDMEKITFVLKGSITSGTGRLLSNEKFEILKGTSIVLEVKSENPTTFKRNKNLIDDLLLSYEIVEDSK